MKRISFFSWSLMLVVLVSGLVFTGCSEDDEEKFDYPMETLYGTWEGTGIYMESNNKWIDPSNWMYSEFQFSITFYEGGKYYGKGYFGTGSGTYKAKGNTITTYVDGEVYLRYDIKSLTANNAELIMYYNDSEDYIRLRVTKKSSTSSELPTDKPKEEVELKLDYTFSESGDMTRATGSEVYSTFYEKYIKTKVLTPKSYTLEFIPKGESNSVIKINGNWNDKDCVRLPEGEYTVIGTSYPLEEYAKIGIKELPSDTVYISFNETVNIVNDMTTLTLNAKYDSFLLLFDSENTSKIELNETSKQLSCDESCYWLFAKETSWSNCDNGFSFTHYLGAKIIRNNGVEVDVEFGKLSLTKGKYYYFNDMTNSFDIPMMESGN